MIDANEAIKNFRQQGKIRDTEQRNDMQSNHEKIVREIDQAMAIVKSHCRLATIGEYRTWLHQYIRSGGTPRHIYDYPFSRSASGFWVAKASFTMKPLYGASSINIIAPHGIKVSGNRGHCTILPEGGSPIGQCPSLFSDI
jgi:hypothetical protein